MSQEDRGEVLVKMLPAKNAKITETFLGLERGLLTFMLQLSYDGVVQAAGGYVLAGGNPRGYVSMRIIDEMLDVVGVPSWEALKGAMVRVKASYAKVYAIGSITEDRWLYFDDFFREEARA